MIQVDIRGEQGNAFWLLGYARKLARKLNETLPVTSERPIVSFDAKKITDEMMQGDYHHLLDTFETYFGEWVELIGREEE